MTNEILNFILDGMRQETLSPCIKLTAYRHETLPWDSKLGGEPYLPLNVAYPTASDGTPLHLLAQLNFSQFPILPGFPHEGILQFFILPDDLYGANLDAPLDQSTFRICYYPTVITDPQALQPYIPLEKTTYYDFPFTGSFALEGSLSKRMISPTDWRFNDLFIKFAERIDPNYQPVSDFYDLITEEQHSLIVDYCDYTGHLMGGYPFFTQSDPREYVDYQDHRIMLLQIDSEGTGDDEILWGDCGVANFFITPKDLANLDFSNVLYTWDCC